MGGGWKWQISKQRGRQLQIHVDKGTEKCKTSSLKAKKNSDVQKAVFIFGHTVPLMRNVARVENVFLTVHQRNVSVSP